MSICCRLMSRHLFLLGFDLLLLLLVIESWGDLGSLRLTVSWLLGLLELFQEWVKGILLGSWGVYLLLLVLLYRFWIWIMKFQFSFFRYVIEWRLMRHIRFSHYNLVTIDCPAKGVLHRRFLKVRVVIISYWWLLRTPNRW
jgi:hypothetical protein